MTGGELLDQLYFPTTEGPRWLRVIVHVGITGIAFVLLTCVSVEGEKAIQWKLGVIAGFVVLVELVNHVLFRAARHEKYRPIIWAIKLAAYTSVLAGCAVVYFQFGGRDPQFVWPPELHGHSLFMMISLSVFYGWLYSVASLSPEICLMSPPMKLTHRRERV